LDDTAPKPIPPVSGASAVREITVTLRDRAGTALWSITTGPKVG
jgi:hypothetical protein